MQLAYSLADDIHVLTRILEQITDTNLKSKTNYFYHNSNHFLLKYKSIIQFSTVLYNHIHMLDVETHSSTSYIFNSYSMINFIRKCSYININDQFHHIIAVSISAHQSMTNLIGYMFEHVVL